MNYTLPGFTVTRDLTGEQLKEANECYYGELDFGALMVSRDPITSHEQERVYIAIQEDGRLYLIMHNIQSTNATIEELAQMIESWLPIVESQIVAGAKFRTATGVIWIVDSVEAGRASMSMEGGSKGNYRNSIAEVVEFLNEENADTI